MSRDSLFMINLELDDAVPAAKWWRRGGARPGFVTALALVLLLSPWIAWRVFPPQRLDVVVIDQTVPHLNWREHAAFTWWLTHRRVATTDGTLYSAEFGYVGYHPRERRGDTLRYAALAGAKIVYIADTYGVYSGDYADSARGASADTTRAGLERSRRLYGGLQVSEVDALARFRANGGVIAAEFNTIASPTWGTAGGRAAEALFGVRHAGWVARWFKDLASRDEIAQWMRDQYRRRFGTEWTFSGAGVVYVSETNDRIAVLQSRELSGSFPVTIDVDSAHDVVVAGVKSGRPYWYWFEGLDLSSHAVPLASVTVHVSEAGKALLAREGFPASTPAIVRHADAPLMVVAAFELADIGDGLPGFQRTRGLDWWQRWSARRNHTPGQMSDAFWNVSVPVWDALLGAARRPGAR